LCAVLWADAVPFGWWVGSADCVLLLLLLCGAPCCMLLVCDVGSCLGSSCWGVRGSSGRGAGGPIGLCSTAAPAVPAVVPAPAAAVVVAACLGVGALWWEWWLPSCKGRRTQQEMAQGSVSPRRHDQDGLKRRVPASHLEHRTACCGVRHSPQWHWKWCPAHCIAVSRLQQTSILCQAAACCPTQTPRAQGKGCKGVLVKERDRVARSDNFTSTPCIPV
jgi:hypothetical protein